MLIPSVRPSSCDPDKEVKESTEPCIHLITKPQKMGQERSNWWIEIDSQWAEANHLNRIPRAPMYQQL